MYKKLKKALRRRNLDTVANDLKELARLKKVKDKKKILYALTPHPGLANVGDQAQAVAINLWLREEFPEYEVFELDKNSCNLTTLSEFSRYFNEDDLVVLHSGGNLGDRGIFSETRRRHVIYCFPQVPVVSLPQTIFFSDTEVGQKEKRRSSALYQAHPKLMVVGRDQQSGALAKELFPEASIKIVPDFVLSLNREDFSSSSGTNDGAPTKQKLMLCLRNDPEGILNSEEKAALAKRLGGEVTQFDTTLDHPIPRKERSKVIEDTLALFDQHEAVVTDRFHGVIFGVLLGKPVVVLPTVDHKLVSAIEWFSDVENVVLSSAENAHEDLKRVLEMESSGIDWKKKHFTPLANEIKTWLEGV